MKGGTFLGSLKGLQGVRARVATVPHKEIGKICQYQRFKEINFQKPDFNVVLEGKCDEMTKACNKTIFTREKISCIKVGHGQLFLLSRGVRLKNLKNWFQR